MRFTIEVDICDYGDETKLKVTDIAKYLFDGDVLRLPANYYSQTASITDRIGNKVEKRGREYYLSFPNPQPVEERWYHGLQDGV